MKKREKIRFITGLMLLMLSPSCADLDREYSTALTEELIAQEYENARMQVINLYAGMEDGLSAIGGAMRASVCDEAEYTPQGDVQRFNSGAWDEYTNPDDVWAHYYTWIRRVNIYLNTARNIQVDLSAYANDPSPAQQEIYRTRKAEIGNWQKEARFLRAYYYFELIKRYGGVPLLKEALALSDDFTAIQRNSLQECIDFIVDECSELGGNTDSLALPVRYPDVDLGRVTRGAALALKSRVLLYAAGDLWNQPESWASGYSAKNLISVSGDRNEKWKKAADAAKAVIDLTGDNGQVYSMMQDYNQLGKVYQNPELILVRRVENSNFFERNNFPAGYPNGSGRITPSQNLVDAYEMTDGSPFDWNNSAHAANPYLNRDPRLAMTVFTNGAPFKGTVIETFTGGANSKNIPNGTTTGYYLRKFLQTSLDLNINQTANHPWILFRITEMYLNYAEALNEYAPGNPDIEKYVNMSRRRPGVLMPAIPGNTDQQEMREKIRNERRIELAFEDHRLWDVHRWLIAGEVPGADEQQGKLYGVEITKQETGGLSYKKILVENRVFHPKMYFYPIPAHVMLNENVQKAQWIQNPLW